MNQCLPTEQQAPVNNIKYNNFNQTTSRLEEHAKFAVQC